MGQVDARCRESPGNLQAKSLATDSGDASRVLFLCGVSIVKQSTELWPQILGQRKGQALHMSIQTKPMEQPPFENSGPTIASDFPHVTEEHGLPIEAS